MNFDLIKIDNFYLEKIDKNINYNKIIINYYDRLFKEMSSDNWNTFKEYLDTNKMSLYDNVRNANDRIKNCNKLWSIDVYDYNLIKDFKSTNLCKNKFCNNCKKVKQASRMSKYIPELSNYKDNLYHLTLTIPNCPGCELKEKLDLMAKSFKRLINIINLHTRSCVSFSEYGYLGCVRSLEITFKNDSYHPHYHCAFAFENLNLEKTIINKYSYDHKKGRGLRSFSDFEIKIQKLWYMIINGMYMSKFQYKKLKDGYSCICDKFSDNDYVELFKYMTKETDETDNLLTYQNFKDIYFSTYKLKQIQGYGCFYRISDNDLEEEIDKVYVDIKNYLQKNNECPRFVLSTPRDLLLSNDDYTLISRKKIYQYLRDLDR